MYLANGTRPDVPIAMCCVLTHGEDVFPLCFLVFLVCSQHKGKIHFSGSVLYHLLLIT
jgi:hypothetical protein